MQNTKEIKILNPHHGFKMMNKIYEYLHFAKLHWNDVINIRLEGKYIIIEVLNVEKQK